jgi:hypothetical protein
MKVQATVIEGLSTPALSSPTSYAQPALKLRGKVTREGTLDAAPAGPCGGTGGGSIPRDCGTKSFEGVSLPLAYRLAAKPKDQLDLAPEVIDDPFANCPSAGTAFPTLVHTKDGEHMRTELPRAELFDPSLGRIVVIARGSESETAGEHTYRTRIRWEVTFVRVKR